MAEEFQEEKDYITAKLRNSQTPVWLVHFCEACRKAPLHVFKQDFLPLLRIFIRDEQNEKQK